MASSRQEVYEDSILLLKSRNGSTFSVRLREYRPGEETGMIDCIRDEYGSTYFKKSLYLPEQIKKESDSGHITFLVAEVVEQEESGEQSVQMHPGEIAGMLILKEFYPEESMCEIASQIFRKKCRGCGLAQPFFEYAMKILKSRHYSAAYCLPVLFHDTTQRLLYRLGLRATGLVLNVFHMGQITHSYKRDTNQKHSQGIQIMALEKKDAGMLYLPPEHIEFCTKIYDTLGVTYQIVNTQEWDSSCYAFLSGGQEKEKIVELLTATDMEWKQDALQCSLEIRIHRVGKDLVEQIQKLHSKYPLMEMQTANIFLNINDKNAVWAYKRLTEAGYFFTGLKPLCSHREYMVLHNAGEVEIILKDYVLTEEFKELANYIDKER